MEKQNRLNLYPLEKTKDEQPVLKAYLYINKPTAEGRYVFSVFTSYKDGKKYYNGTIEESSEKKEAPKHFLEPKESENNFNPDLNSEEIPF